MAIEETGMTESNATETGHIGQLRIIKAPPKRSKALTKISKYVSPLSTPIYQNRFDEVVRRVRGHSEYSTAYHARAPYGFYSGRPIIGECTKINGGIYLGVKPQEALVVDERYGTLERVYTELMIRFNDRANRTASFEQTIINEVIKIVNEKIQYSPSQLSIILKEEQIAFDQKVALGLFIQAGCGVTRHKVLLAAYLLEKLGRSDILNGQIYLETSSPTEDLVRERLVFSSQTGPTYLFDPNFEC